MKTFLFFGILITLISHNWVIAEDLNEFRKFTTEVNPGCSDSDYPINCTDTAITLVHIRSDGLNDSYHFLWSFIGAPSLLMARTPLNSSLSIDWTQIFKPEGQPSINFKPIPFYTFGWSLVKVWIADDAKDEVSLDKIDQNSIIGYPTKNFTWERDDKRSYANETDVRYTLVARNYEHQSGNHDLGSQGYFKFTIRMKRSSGYSDVLPYMLYSENSTQVDIAFNDIQLNMTEKEYPAHPRVGFKFILVQEGHGNLGEQMRLVKTKTLDDEHTPGVFETYSVRTPVLNGTDESFIQWKPICYTGEVRDVTDSVDVWSPPLQNSSSFLTNDTDVEDSILWSYYHRAPLLNNILVQSVNVSFGTQQDGFYNKTKHISWTYSTGFGKPPEDFVSKVVLAVVAVGLGIPAIMIVLSVTYVLTKRLRQPRDELLLGR